MSSKDPFGTKEEEEDEKYAQGIKKISDDMAEFFDGYIVRARAAHRKRARTKLTSEADKESFDHLMDAGHNDCYARFFPQKGGAQCHCECLDPCSCLVHRMRPSQDIVLGQIGFKLPM